MALYSAGPIRGVGIGLRTPHFKEILTDLPKVPWFEALTENYFAKEGLAQHHLSLVRAHYPIAFHGVGLSIGSADPIDLDYLNQVKMLINQFEPAWVSDHLSWSSIDSNYIPELLPLPLTVEALEHIVAKIVQVQDRLAQPILLENISSYLCFEQAEFTEWDFIKEIAVRSGCFILLDINNVYVSSMNHGWKSKHYIDSLPIEIVAQFHLGGFENKGTHLLDTHGDRVDLKVWELYKFAVARFGAKPTLIEWDTHIPSFGVLLQESAKAQKICNELETITN